MRLLLIATVALAATGARAEGFAVRDLSLVAPEVSAALGGDFSLRVEPRRVTLSCPSCEGEPMIDLQIGRQTDGTEQRVRSGQTPISRLEALCQEKSPSCRLSGLEIAPAIGWISTYPMGAMTGSTVVILRDGDLLTIRSQASKAKIARDNAEKVVAAVKPRLIGN